MPGDRLARPAALRADLAAIALIAGAAFLAYANTFGSPFLFDDLPRIVRNPLAHDPWPPWNAMSQTSRPLVQLTFAVNHAISGLATWSYHLVNVAIHAANGVLFFAVVRRALARTGTFARRGAANGIALAAALLWTVHPLATEAVTYLVQRSECLAGSFLLLLLYALDRAASARRPGPWHVVAVAACVCGMASKPVMASAPFVALLYDRTFLAGSFRGALAARGAVHGGQFASLLLLPVLLAAAPMDWRYSSALGVEGIAPLDYARTQAGVVLHYLRLAFWPSGLTFDYAWPVARNGLAVAGSLVPIAAIAAISIVLLVRRSPLGFLGAFFFLVLAPTSSVLPILDLAFEHRMYLPLAAVVVAAVLGGRAFLKRIASAAAWDDPLAQRVARGVVATLAIVLGSLTLVRNADYRSAIAIWTDTIEKRPNNPRARVNLAHALAEREGFARGLAEVETALRAHPDYASGQFAAGYFLAKLGRLEEAVPRLRRAVEQLPESAEAHYVLGSALTELGAFDEAVAHLDQSVRLEPWRAEAHNNLGIAHLRRGFWDAAIPHFERALELNPVYTNARFNLAVAYGTRGDVARARTELENTLAIDAGYEPARRLLEAHDEEMGQARAAAGADTVRASTGGPGTPR